MGPGNADERDVSGFNPMSTKNTHTHKGQRKEQRQGGKKKKRAKVSTTDWSGHDEGCQSRFQLRSAFKFKFNFKNTLLSVKKLN